MLKLLILNIIIGIFALFFLKSNEYSRQISLTSASISLLLGTSLFAKFNKESYVFQEITMYNFGTDFLNFSFSFGLDGISVSFLFLSCLLIFICILFVWEDTKFKAYAINLFLIQLFLVLIFSVLDLFLFYIFFEAILIPMYLIIGIWGSRERKIRAVYLFFFYTLCGSILLLVAILYIYNQLGTLSLEKILAYPFSITEQYLLWIAFFFSFASKIPMFPFHIWLPEAHVEAPTVGSVLLAGILLKLGVYGFIRFSLTLFPFASIYFAPLMYALSIIGILYASMAALRQTDLKRIIAYSSIAHMNLVTLGIFSFNNLGIEGSVFQSISHGFVSGGLFLLIGIIYDRYHTRFIYYYGGLVHFMPIYSMLFLVFTMANIALPGTSSFVGEFLLLIGIFKQDTITAVFATLGVILGGSYSLWLYNRISFGNIKKSYTILFKDITYREWMIMFPLFIFVIWFGISPNIILSYLHFSAQTVSTLFL